MMRMILIFQIPEFLTQVGSVKWPKNYFQNIATSLVFRRLWVWIPVLPNCHLSHPWARLLTLSCSAPFQVALEEESGRMQFRSLLLLMWPNQYFMTIGLLHYVVCSIQTYQTKTCNDIEIRWWSVYCDAQVSLAINLNVHQKMWRCSFKMVKKIKFSSLRMHFLLAYFASCTNLKSSFLWCMMASLVHTRWTDKVVPAFYTWNMEYICWQNMNRGLS